MKQVFILYQLIVSSLMKDFSNKTNYQFEIQNQQVGDELKQVECTKPLYISFFVAFFYINNPAFRKTNSYGKNLDARQKYYV